MDSLDTSAPRRLGTRVACGTALALVIVSLYFVIVTAPLALVPSAAAMWLLICAERRRPGTGLVPATFLACVAVFVVMMVVVLGR